MLLRTQPDERLAALVRDGGTAPFDEIVRRHRPALIAFARSLAPASRADDVVQDSFLKAYAALQEGAEPALLRAWLFRIVRNTAIDEQRVVRHHEQLDENYDGVEQPPQALDRREQIAGLVTAINDLPSAQREAIVKRELEGRGHEEIARALSISPGAVRQLIYRARHSLREAAGAIIPVTLIRAASLPGAGEAAGGLGIAGAVKLGLAAIVATGTVVAGTAIDQGPVSGRAESLPSAGASRGPGGGNGLELVDGRSGADRHSADSRSGTFGDGEKTGSSQDHGSSGTSGSSGGSDHGGSSGDGSSSNSGEGTSGSGSGSSGSGDGGTSLDGMASSDGSSGSDGGGSGSGGTSTVTTTTTTSSEGPS